MNTEKVAVSGPTVAVVSRGPITAMEQVRADRVIRSVLRRHHIESPASVRLARSGTFGATTIAQVNTRFRGTAIRVQAEGPGGFALTFAAERLDRQLDRLTGTAEPRWAPDPGRAAPAFVSADRAIVRRKHCHLNVFDPVGATAAMDRMDFDAHLFTDAETGEDAVVYWAGPLGVRMARQRQLRPPLTATWRPLTMNPLPTRDFTEAEAITRLCAHGLPFLFFTDPSDRRGRLLYRRYDGDLGLVAGNDVPIE
ncbi:sigma 54 modulation/S30EA ribosomal C-terminal domain-containing protein [Nocardia tengchongensis]|uniref:sigma 54 modulation/S30EA ribosomal C-terminal domain-containing protein n=1 Tax=Nocardia tengchongensis TaxID=2055889 RepID=UPI00369EFC5F